jgi:uncharacterized protein YgiM (DUF1202 family)
VKRIVSFALVLLMVAGLLPMFGIGTAFAAETAVVNNPNSADRLHLRASPSASSASYGRYYNGVVVTILEYTASGYVKVRVGSGDGSRVGYMLSNALAFGSAGGSVRSAIPTLYVKNSSLNLRASNSTSSGLLGSYKSGTAVDLIGYGSSWHHVRVNGKYGYMLASGLTSAPNGGSSSGSSGGSSSSITSGSVGYVSNGKRLHLRSGAGTGYSSLGLYYTGCPVTALASSSNGWVKVRIGNVNQGSQTGYMMTEYLAFGNVLSSIKNAMPKFTNYSSARGIYDKPYLSEYETSNAQYLGWSEWIGYEVKLDILGELSNGWVHVRLYGGNLVAGAIGNTGFTVRP